MPGTYVGQAIVTLAEDYENARVGPNDDDAQLSFALLKFMDSGRPFYSWDVLHDYFVNRYQPAGRGCIPWTVVRGFSPEGARDEGHDAGVLSTAVQACVLVDLEDDKRHYWQGIEAAVDAWIDGFVAGGGREVFLWPDSRADKLAGENFWRWWSKDIVTRVWPQAYWSIFYAPGTPNRVRRGIDNAVQPLLQGGIPANAITPTLMCSDEDGNPIPWAELREGILYCKDLGTNGWALWRREFLSIEQRDGLRAMEDPFAVAPPPPEPTPLPPQSEIDQLLGRLKALSIDIRSTTDQIIDLRAAGK